MVMTGLTAIRQDLRILSIMIFRYYVSNSISALLSHESLFFFFQLQIKIKPLNIQMLISMQGMQGNVSLILGRKQTEYGEVLSEVFHKLSIVWGI